MPRARDHQTTIERRAPSASSEQNAPLRPPTVASAVETTPAGTADVLLDLLQAINDPRAINAGLANSITTTAQHLLLQHRQADVRSSAAPARDSSPPDTTVSKDHS